MQPIVKQPFPSLDLRVGSPKNEASAYEGGPTRRWLKVKQKDWTVADDGWRRRLFEEDGR
jgi:hypothetical protein